MNYLLENYISVDGSNIDAFSKVEDSDLYLKVDLNSFYIINLNNDNICFFFCDIYNNSNNNHLLCTRTKLKNKLKEIYPLSFKIGFEIEFYILNRNLTPIDKDNYLGIKNSNYSSIIRNKLIKHLEKNKFNIECYHHEAGYGQNEISLKYEDALVACDKLELLKLIIKEFSIKENIIITLMPKITSSLPGSGLHLNCSIYENNCNLFESKTNINNFTLSFINGILLYSKESSLIYNPSINSYKRLVKNEEVPTSVSWSYSNRRSMIRVPKINDKINRIELRNIDSLINPYLTAFIILEAGLIGVSNKLNIYKENRYLKYHKLPSSYFESLYFFKKSVFLKQVLGRDLFNKYLNLKQKEFTNFNLNIHKWEIDKYL